MSMKDLAMLLFNGGVVNCIDSLITLENLVNLLNLPIDQFNVLPVAWVSCPSLWPSVPELPLCSLSEHF